MNSHLLSVLQDYNVMFVSFMIPEKQVLAVCSIQVLPVFHGFPDGRGGRMLVILERNPEVGEEFVEVGIAVHFSGVGGWGLGVRVEMRCLASLLHGVEGVEGIG